MITFLMLIEAFPPWLCIVIGTAAHALILPLVRD